MVAEDFTRTILETMNAHLKTHGFRRKGATFSRDCDGVIQVIQFQKSVSSNRDSIKATVNLQVYSTELGEKLGLDRRNLLLREPHWSQRIGFVGPWNRDQWWGVATEEEARQASIEIESALTQQCLPVLDGLSTTGQLQSLWLLGSSPGLTEKSRLDYLRRLAG